MLIYEHLRYWVCVFTYMFKSLKKNLKISLIVTHPYAWFSMQYFVSVEYFKDSFHGSFYTMTSSKRTKILRKYHKNKVVQMWEEQIEILHHYVVVIPCAETCFPTFVWCSWCAWFFLMCSAEKKGCHGDKWIMTFLGELSRVVRNGFSNLSRSLEEKSQ